MPVLGFGTRLPDLSVWFRSGHRACEEKQPVGEGEPGAGHWPAADELPESFASGCCPVLKSNT